MYVQIGYNTRDGYNYYERRVYPGELLNGTNAGYPGRWVFRTYRSKGIQQIEAIANIPCDCCIILKSSGVAMQDLLRGGGKLEIISWGTHRELQGREQAAAAD